MRSIARTCRAVSNASHADGRFYSALTEAVRDSREEAAAEARERLRDDIQFSHVGGKQKLPKVINALRALQLRLRVICDFDVLNAEKPLRPIYEALGGDWREIEADWKRIHAAVRDKATAPPVKADLLAKIKRVFEEADDTYLARETAQKARELLKLKTGWDDAKVQGTSAIPSGDATGAWSRLDAAFRMRGLHVVPGGALESWVRTIGNKSGAWVNAVRENHGDLAGDPHLQQARDFLKSVTESKVADQ